jgi:hypothetical protein
MYPLIFQDNKMQIFVCKNMHKSGALRLDLYSDFGFMGILILILLKTLLVLLKMRWNGTYVFFFSFLVYPAV